jgi:arylsulfatase A-like enzyme
MSHLPPAALLTLAALLSCGERTPSAPEAAPNVLLISIDTLRADRLGLYGYARPTSPELDAFAAGAVVFEAAQASAPWTLPSLASVMTAEVVSTHECWDYGSVLDGSFTTLAERLLAAGYDTACVVSHIFATSRHGLQQGFVHTDDTYAYPEVDPSQNITSQVISDKGIRFLEQKRASPEPSPWLLWLHYFDPHREYMKHPGVSEGFLTSGERPTGTVLGEVYDGEVRYTDMHVGRVLARLRELGFAEGTVVLLLADHGEEFHDHGGLGHGHSLHREVIRVPLVLRAPGLAPGRVQTVVSHVDVMPTVLALVGLPVPAGIAGRSLVPVARGDSRDETGALAEVDHGGIVLDSWCTRRFRLIRSGKDGSLRLFDLAADPEERNDVAAQNPAVVAELLAELERAKGAGRERGKLFGTARELTLTPGIRADLEALGYGGSADDPAAEEAGNAGRDGARDG